MHIAFLTPEYPHPRVRASAGIGTSIKNLIHGIQGLESTSLSTGTTDSRKQTKFTVFIYGQKETDQWEENGICFHLITHKKYRLGGFFRYRKFLNNYINTIVKEKGIDVIEAPDWTGITAYMNFSIPIVIRLHGTDTYFCNLEGRAQKKKNFYLEKKALFGADAITSVSTFTAQETARLFSIKKPMEVIYNAIDVQFFLPSNDASHANTILYFGSVIRKKGVLELAQAFKQVLSSNPQANLIFLGKDVKDAQEGVSTISLIKEVVGKHALRNITFVSQVPYSEVKNYIAEAAVICLPSHAEAFPMTWLEAMAMEKPLVTSDVGWASEVMIHKKTGFTVNPTNIKALSEALLEMLANPEEAKALGKAARSHLMTHFNPAAIALQNVAFYQKVLEA